MRLDALLAAYRRDVPLEDSSARQYGIVLRQAIRFAGEGVLAEEFFEPSSLKAFAYWLRSTPDSRGQERRGRTVNGRLAMARTLWKWAHETGLTPHICPSKWKRMREEREPPTAWSVEEMRRIVAHVAWAPRLKGWSPAHWRALLSVYWEVGPRIQALLACRCADLSRDHLHLAAMNDKSLSGSRHKLTAPTVALLQAITRDPGDDRLLPWPRSIDTLRRHFRVILKAAGLSHGRRDLFHKLRRTHGTHLWIATGSAEQAQRSLNHRHVATTIANYLDPTHLADPAPADVLPALPR